MLTRDELISGWWRSYDNGTFLIPKHDGSNMVTVYATPRSILDAQLANNLGAFLHSGEYSINVYADANYPKGSGYYEVVPAGIPPFNVAGSGVGPHATPAQASGTYDRLVVVWGSKADWHCHAQNSGWIAAQVGARFTLSGML